MHFGVSTILLLIAAFLPSHLNAAPPVKSIFILCRRDDPDLDNCIKKSLNTMKTKLLKGVPDINLQPLEPLRIHELEFSEDLGPAHFHQTLTNVVVHGLGNYTITKVKADLDNGHLHFDMTAPSMRIEADYYMDGQAVWLPIKGHGKCQYNFTSLRASADIQGEFQDHDGSTYMHVNDFKWRFDTDKGHSYFSNLFGSEGERLGEIVNSMLNQNWRVIWEAYKHLPEAAFSDVFLNITNKVFDNYAVNELFP